MKISKFNIIKKYENGVTLAYNSFSGALSKVNNNFLKLLESIEKGTFFIENLNNDEKKLVEKMKKAGYILNSKVDEMKYLEYLSQLQKYKSKKMKLVIAPTLNCNFKCDYCFEKPIIGDMGIEVQNQIIEMIKKKISEDSIKELSIVWYGGEPLLCKDIINNLSDKILDLCNFSNIAYSASIITNGYLINEESLNDFKKNRIVSIQITIDGTPDIHNVRRRLKQNANNGTFAKILENINMLSSQMNVSIRMNIDKRNKDNIKAFMKILNKKILNKEKITVSLGHVFDDNDNFGIEDCSFCLSKSEYSKYKYELLECAEMYGFKKTKKRSYPKLRLIYCSAISYNSYVIDPLGNVFKCWNEICEEKNRITTVKEILEKKNAEKNIKSSQWVMHNVFNEEKCKKCNILPICAGGCPSNQIRKGHSPVCEDYKYIIEKLMIYHSK